MKCSYIYAQKLKSERSKSFAVSILLQTKDVGGPFRVPGTGKYPPSSGKFNRSWSKSRRAYGGLGYSFSLKVKWGNISAQKLETECLKSFAVSISLQNKGTTTYFSVQWTGNIPQVTGNPPEVSQNHDGLKGVSATLSVLR